MVKAIVHVSKVPALIKLASSAHLANFVSKLKKSVTTYPLNDALHPITTGAGAAIAEAVNWIPFTSNLKPACVVKRLLKNKHSVKVQSELEIVNKSAVGMTISFVETPFHSNNLVKVGTYSVPVLTFMASQQGSF